MEVSLMEQKNSFTNEKNLRAQKILQPKNDVVFQALFSRGKENITKAFLEDILKIKIHKIELDKSKDLLNDNIRDKNGRLDLRVVINDNIECDIEIQLVKHEQAKERFVYYWAKMFTANLQVGDDYSKLRKTIGIIIVDDEFPEFKDIPKSHTKWQIREEEYTQKILTPYFELDIIELPKALKEYENNKSNTLLQWMMFLDNPETEEVSKIMENNEDIKNAKQELDKISQDDILRRMALKAELERMDQKQLNYEARRDGRLEGIEEGIKKGKKEGLKEGEKAGILKAKKEDAKKMLEKGIELSVIMEITGLSEEEILN